jgi:hypothetical protein
MAESNIQDAIRLSVSRAFGRAAVLFRNNRGKAWIGKSARTPGGLVVIENPRRIEFGFVNGASDLIGWTSVEITADMIGKRLAVFTAIEVKTKIGDSSKEQKTFIRNVKDAGGIAGVARSDEEAIKIIRGLNED